MSVLEAEAIMRLRNIKGSIEIVGADPRCFDKKEEIRGRFLEIFNNNNPVEAEVGMGKGRFLIEMAKRYPNTNFFGIERYESVIIRALQKLDRNEKEGIPSPDNLRFLRMDATDICDFFEPASINKIYLNFSDPWPKDRHKKRRLVSGEFLNRFDKVLIRHGTIEFKTDNKDLFHFGLSEIGEDKWKLLYCTEDLHRDEEAMKNNIMTEYEEKFSSLGNPICKFIISKCF